MERKNKVTDFVYAALFAALIAVLGLISIPLPFSPVPVTGQSLGIMLTGGLLTVRQTFYSLTTFLLLGAAGAPVYAGMTGGPGILAGPRGGYLLGFLAGAVVIALLKGRDNTKWRLLLANISGGIVVVYLFGIIWLGYVTGMSWEKAFAAGVLPYIPGDLLKAFAATFISIAVNRQLPKKELPT